MDSSAPRAHTRNAITGEEHPLDSHLRAVADRAAKAASKFAAGELGRLAGLLHDIGKVNPRFQEYLHACEAGNGRGRRAPHSIHGAKIARERDLTPLVFAIAGHHCGLQDFVGLKRRIQDSDSEAEKVIERALGWLGELPEARLPKWLDANDPLQCEFLTRMVFSGLVDADWLDTEAHFDRGVAEKRGGYPSLDELSRRFHLYHESKIAPRLIADATTVNRVRAEIYQSCLSAAESGPGVFCLTVPTGGGKTLSGMAFALKHAIRHGMERVVVAIPYTSIIDQTVDVYREVFDRSGEPSPVLEHHSAIDLPDDPGESQAESELRRRLAAENWDAPIIVTTQVQLFESLFSNKPSRCRKLHNVANSVLILDEVQTLPLHLWQPLVSGLRELAGNYSVTVVLCTATQPALDVQSQYLTGFRDVKEIVSSYQRHFDALRRVDYQVDLAPVTWAEVADMMRREKQSLAVVNTKKDALALLDGLDDASALHLSTLLYPRHRRAVLRLVRWRLRAGLPCRVVSTQVVEAGVDLDFPVVFRAIGPLDRIAQVAGRCNREGRLADLGRACVFNPSEGTAPRGTYRTGIDEARIILQRENADLHDADLYREFFRIMAQDVDTDSKKVQEARARLDFEKVAERVRLIEEDTVPVIVAREHRKVGSVLAQAKAMGGLTAGLWRRMQAHTVSVYRRDFERYQREGLVEQVVPEVWVWKGGYDRVRGLVTDAPDPADLIV